jgi:2'-5' RNA ligase
VRERVEEAAAACAPFEARLAGLGAFRSASRARVLWAALADDPPGASSVLAGAIDEALAREFGRETRAFTAHLTVARSDPPLSLDDTDLSVPIPRIGWRVDRVVLFRSHLQRPAPRYEALATYPLGLHGEGQDG